jgi:23S rRNA (cytosine1962-C5)-methyltransferase
LSEALRTAWKKRKDGGFWEGTETLRVFHGPGEGDGPLREVYIECFGRHAWVGFWSDPTEKLKGEISEFLSSVGIESASMQIRPPQGGPEDSKALFGAVPLDPFLVQENGGKFWIKLLSVKHPGIFLDHAPLRKWLQAHSSGLSVLNTFSYTGSLSVAAGLGGAKEVVTLDLSKATTRWAEENGTANFGEKRAGHDYLYGDVFDWLPRWARAGRRFDLVILDPPSFSRGKKGEFSTSKDLVRLHEVALGVLNEGGILVSSINSAKIPRLRFEREVFDALGVRKLRGKVLSRIELPATFPTREGEESYLKGVIVQVS